MNGAWFRRRNPLTLRRYTKTSGLTILNDSPASGFYEKSISSTGNRRARPKGRVSLFTSSTQLTVTTTDVFDGVGTIPETDGWREVSVLKTSGWSALDTHITPNNSAALAAALAEARQYKVNLGLMLAEYRQSAELVTQLARMMRHIAFSPKQTVRRLVVRFKWAKAGHHSLSDDMANRWLMYQYGVMPTVRDIIAISNMLSGQPVPELVRIIRRTSPGQTSETITRGSFGYRQVSRKRTTRANILVRFDANSFTSTMANVGLTNPFSILYDRIPLSFLLDWVVNIGDVLYSLDNPLVLGSSVVVTYDSKAEIKTEIMFRNGFATGKQVQKTRSPAATVSTIVPLSYEPSLSAQRLLSAVSLIRQRSPKQLFLIKPQGGPNGHSR